MTTVVCDRYVVAHRNLPKARSMGLRLFDVASSEGVLVVEAVSVSSDNYPTQTVVRLGLQLSLGIQGWSRIW